MTRMTGPDCAVMCNLINTHIRTHTHTLICEWHRMTRMTGPDCVVMCNLINIHTHTQVARVCSLCHVCSVVFVLSILWVCIYLIEHNRAIQPQHPRHYILLASVEYPKRRAYVSFILTGRASNMPSYIGSCESGTVHGLLNRKKNRGTSTKLKRY